MPFHKSASSSASEDASEENKPKKRKAESKMTTTTTMMTITNSSNKKAMPKVSTTKKQEPSPAPAETTESAPKEKKAKKLKAKKSNEQSNSGSVTQTVDHIGKCPGGYQPLPVNSPTVIVDLWFQEHTNEQATNQWKSFLETLDINQVGTLHGLLLSSGASNANVSKQTETKGKETDTGQAVLGNGEPASKKVMPGKPKPASKKAGANAKEENNKLKVTTKKKDQGVMPEKPMPASKKVSAMNKSPMACGYEAAMRLKAAHSKTSKNKLFSDSREDVTHAGEKIQSPTKEVTPSKSMQMPEINWDALLGKRQNDYTVFILGKPYMIKVTEGDDDDKDNTKNEDNYAPETSENDLETGKLENTENGVIKETESEGSNEGDKTKDVNRTQQIEMMNQTSNESVSFSDTEAASASASVEMEPNETKLLPAEQQNSEKSADESSDGEEKNNGKESDTDGSNMNGADANKGCNADDGDIDETKDTLTSVESSRPDDSSEGSLGGFIEEIEVPPKIIDCVTVHDSDEETG